MKTFKLVPLAMLVVAAACGGSNGAPTTADFQANAMTFDKVSISQNDGDDNEPASALAPSAALTMAPAASSDAVTREIGRAHV